MIERLLGVDLELVGDVQIGRGPFSQNSRKNSERTERTKFQLQYFRFCLAGKRGAHAFGFWGIEPLNAAHRAASRNLSWRSCFSSKVVLSLGTVTGGLGK